jgi:hypothetical protein
LVQTILPETIIETRIKKLRNQATTEYLVKWKNLLVEEATWEDDFFMQKHLWLDKCRGKNFFEGDGHVKP